LSFRAAEGLLQAEKSKKTKEKEQKREFLKIFWKLGWLAIVKDVIL
jgi:hypothetical protein